MGKQRARPRIRPLLEGEQASLLLAAASVFMSRHSCGAKCSCVGRCCLDLLVLVSGESTRAKWSRERRVPEPKDWHRQAFSLACFE